MSPVSCPNCRSIVPVGATLCPHCGAALPPPQIQPIWPPPPGGGGGAPPPQALEPNLLTKTVWGDVTLGVVVTLASLFIGGLGFIVMPILYFALRPNAPMFARGIGYGVLTSLVLLLGAFALCFYGISHERV